MAGENRLTNCKGVVSTEFGIGVAAPTTGIDVSDSAQGVTIQNFASGARAVVRIKDPRLGGTAAISTDVVTSRTTAINAISGRWGHFSAPFALFATPCQGNLRLDAPGVIVGAGVPVFSMADAMDAANGPYTRMSLVGAAGNWFGFTGSPGGIFDYEQNTVPAKAFFRMAAPSYADLSFFIGGFSGANALLSSGPDPSAFGLTGCAAFVKLAADPNWNAFVRLTGSAVPTKIDMGVPAVAGTTYLFLYEELTGPATAVFSIYSTAGALLATTSIPHADPAALAYKLCAGAYTAVAAARDIDYYNGMVAQLNSWDS